MAEQTFRSPGLFEREIDQSVRQDTGPVGVPAGIIGTSDKGPAFVPVTVADFANFEQTFGGLNPKQYGPYAAAEFLKHKQSLTFMRVLGAGTTETVEDIAKAGLTGQVKNAGFVVTGSNAANDTSGRHMGAVQFIAGLHTLKTEEAFGAPMFSENNSVVGSTVNLVRGVVLLASGTRLMVLNGDESALSAFSATTPDDSANVVAGKFKLVLSSSNGSSFGVADGNKGIRIFTASLNPTDNDYFAKLLNRDPDKFAEMQHVVYADFAVDDEIATVITASVLSGSANTSLVSGDKSMVYRNAFGHFDARYTTPKTPSFISQPFGKTEYDLFHFEALDDGSFANELYKISISNLKISSDQTNPYGTFTILVRSWDDTDTNQIVLEQYSNCSLDPNASNYVARLIGDRRVRFDFDAENESERRLISEGRYANKSKFVRIVMNDQVSRKLVPPSTLPFGFRGVEILKTNDNLTDTTPTSRRLAGVGVGTLANAIVPPIPFRFKVTKGEVATSGFVGNPGPTEITNGNYYWGVKFERNTLPLNSNVVAEKNELLNSYTKFLGIKKLDTVVTGSGADSFNNNKFTLAQVALSNTSVNDLTSSVETHMKEAAYIRNGKPDPTTYVINDGVLTGRITFGTIAAQSAVQFNRFSSFAKFTTFLVGGFDGVNILDKNANKLNDRSVSFDVGGAAEATYVSPGLAQNQAGVATQNSTVSSYKTAINVMTNPTVVNINILAIPGIREPYITDYAMKKVRDYGMAIYVTDIANYDESGNRLYDDSILKPDVGVTATSFDSRALDTSFAAAYFPDVFIDDAKNKRRVKVPASVAAVTAYGMNDKIAYPWYAPAGFNRAALDFVTNVNVRLNSSDRDTLSDVRINPIASFPRQGFVIFGQKTLQQAKSALDRVNVRRLLLEVKRIVNDAAQKIVFEQNTAETRASFVKETTTAMGLIQASAGLESFRVIMNSTNNTADDADANKVNGRIVIVPTRTIESIALDFVITSSGVSFV